MKKTKHFHYVFLVLLLIFVFFGVIYDRHEMIHVFHPSSGEVVEPGFKVKGEAVGYWFFEGSFPVQLVDEDGEELFVAPAMALSDWMIEDFVPFELEIGDFDAGESTYGELIFRRDNPSDLPENDAEFRVPIRFN